MNAYQRARKRYGTLFPDRFIEQSKVKVTQGVIDGLGMEVFADGERRFNVPATMAKTNVKAVLKSIK